VAKKEIRSLKEPTATRFTQDEVSRIEYNERIKQVLLITNQALWNYSWGE
jgi:hypothetical protein